MTQDQRSTWLQKLDEDCPYQMVLPRRQLMDDSAIMDFLLSYVGKFDLYVEDQCPAYVRYCFKSRWTRRSSGRASSREASHFGSQVEQAAYSGERSLPGGDRRPAGRRPAQLLQSRAVDQGRPARRAASVRRQQPGQGPRDVRRLRQEAATRAADHPAKEPGAGGVAQGPPEAECVKAERLCRRVSTALQIAALIKVNLYRKGSDPIYLAIGRPDGTHPPTPLPSDQKSLVSEATTQCRPQVRNLPGVLFCDRILAMQIENWL